MFRNTDKIYGIYTVPHGEDLNQEHDFVEIRPEPLYIYKCISMSVPRIDIYETGTNDFVMRLNRIEDIMLSNNKH